MLYVRDLDLFPVGVSSMISVTKKLMAVQEYKELHNCNNL